jgi:hypothetical protein
MAATSGFQAGTAEPDRARRNEKSVRPVTILLCFGCGGKSCEAQPAKQFGGAGSLVRSGLREEALPETIFRECLAGAGLEFSLELARVFRSLHGNRLDAFGRQTTKVICHPKPKAGGAGSLARISHRRNDGKAI